MKRFALAMGVVAAVGLGVGCANNGEYASSGTVHKASSTTGGAKATTGPAAVAPAKKDRAFNEIVSGNTVYVFGSIASANAHLNGTPLANGVKREKFAKDGKDVVFENLGPAETDELVAAYAKANGIKVK